MTNKELLDAIRTEFYKRIEAKTGWGKDQVKAEFEQSANTVLAEALDRKCNPDCVPTGQILGRHA